MEMMIEELAGSRIAYFRSVGEYGANQNKELMDSFKEWVQLNGMYDHSTILAIPQDNPEATPKDDCRYDVCVMIDHHIVPKPACVGEFPGGKYAVFLLDHTKEAVNECWNTIFAVIERKNLLIRDQPIIERYTPQMIGDHLCEILVPIK